MSDVYLIEGSRFDGDADLERKIETLWAAAGFSDLFEPHDLAALKLHVGEPGSKTFVEPRLVAALVRRMASAGAKPFLTDTAVLYRSPRDNGPGHTVGFEPDTYVDVSPYWSESMEWLGRNMAFVRKKTYDPNSPDGSQQTKEKLAQYRGSACGVTHAEALKSYKAYPAEIL